MGWAIMLAVAFSSRWLRFTIGIFFQLLLEWSWVFARRRLWLAVLLLCIQERRVHKWRKWQRASG